MTFGKKMNGGMSRLEHIEQFEFYACKNYYHQIKNIFDDEHIDVFEIE